MDLAGDALPSAERLEAEMESLLVPERFVGSALVFAFMFTGRLMRYQDLAAAQRLTALLYKGRTVRGRSFDTMVDYFKVMLNDGNVSNSRDWLARARLWRVILLASQSGYCAPTPPPTLSLLHPSAALRLWLRACAPPWPPLLTNPVSAPLCPLYPPGEPSDSLAFALLAAPFDESLVGYKCKNPLLRKLTLHYQLDLAKDSGREGPLAGFSARAIVDTMPAALREIAGAANAATPTAGSSKRGALGGGSGKTINAERVWTTLLVAAMLEKMPMHFLAEDYEEDGVGVTLLDRSQLWLDAAVARQPRLADALPELKAEAERVVQVWAAKHTAVTALFRSAEKRATRLWLLADHAFRTAGRVAKALRMNHETLYVATSLPVETVLRWQRSVVICTSLIAMLCVEARESGCWRRCVLPHPLPGALVLVCVDEMQRTPAGAS